jgi:hypothetical protein
MSKIPCRKLTLEKRCPFGENCFFLHDPSLVAHHNKNRYDRAYMEVIQQILEELQTLRDLVRSDPFA